MRKQNGVYGYVAPTYTQAKSIIWRDPNMIDKYLPHDYCVKNEAELFVKFATGSILVIKGSDQPDSLRGINFNGVALDELQDMRVETWEQILRPVLAESPERWALFAFTPRGYNHAHTYWTRADAWPDWYKSFLPASVSKIIPEKELDKAKQEMPEAFYRQEFECDFLADEERTLISIGKIESARGISVFSDKTRRLIAVDPAAGGDESVIYVFENTKIIDSKFLYERDTMKLAGEIMVLAGRHKINDIAMDITGFAPLADRLREMGKRVIRINSSEKSTNPQFLNFKTEMWVYLAEKIRNCEIDYPQDQELRRQLSKVLYDVTESTGKIKIASKADTKKLLGRSPDRADAFAIGIWALQRVQPMEHNKIIDFLSQESRQHFTFASKSCGY